MPTRFPTAATIQGPYAAIPNGKRTPKDGPTDAEAVVSKTCNLNQGKTTMKLLNILKSFKNDESGAVTVDWVVLTGAVVGLALIIGTTVRTSINTAASNIASDVVSSSNN